MNARNRHSSVGIIGDISKGLFAVGRSTGFPSVVTRTARIFDIAGEKMLDRYFSVADVTLTGSGGVDFAAEDPAAVDAFPVHPNNNRSTVTTVKMPRLLRHRLVASCGDIC